VTHFLSPPQLKSKEIPRNDHLVGVYFYQNV
jgi:hypothetical protein